MNKTTFIISILLIIVCADIPSSSYLVIKAPPQLVNLIQSQPGDPPGSIRSYLSGFGQYEYGKKIEGVLYNQFPMNGCELNSSVISDFINKNSFLLIKNGECSSFQKVQNAQKLGALLAIVYDDYQLQPMTAYDENNSVSIPSVVIQDGKNGRIISDFMYLNPDNVIVTFEVLVKKADYFKVFFFITDFDNKNASKMIKSFGDERKRLSGNLYQIVPIFNLELKLDNYQSYCKIIQNQYHFCPYQANIPRIDQFVDEAVRQLCIVNQSEDFWFQYYDVFYSKCQTKQDYSKCSKFAINTLLQYGFNQTAYANCINDQYILFKFLQYQQLNSDTSSQFVNGFIPGVKINNNIYFGNLEGKNIAQAICSTLYTQVGGCLPQQTQKQSLTRAINFNE